MILQKIPKNKRREKAWRSQAHRRHVTSHACINCGTVHNVQAAHLRIATDGGTSLKPSDYYCTPLCHECHALQHQGERTFWDDYAVLKGHTVEEVIAELI